MLGFETAFFLNSSWKLAELIDICDRLKPPQNPTAKNNLAIEERIFLWSDNPITKPKTSSQINNKSPKREMSVVQIFNLSTKSKPSYPSSPLPINTAINSFIICYLFLIPI
jgi:hypothetical protein